MPIPITNNFGHDSLIWPRSATDPITMKMDYYNEVTIELDETVFQMIPYRQFKSHLLPQGNTSYPMLSLQSK